MSYNNRAFCAQYCIPVYIPAYSSIPWNALILVFSIDLALFDLRVPNIGFSIKKKWKAES